MKLSTRTRYGSRALLDLALHIKANVPVPLKDIAQRQEISLAYLEQLVSPLIAGGIIRSARGPKGGIVLAKPAREINLKEIVEILEGSTDPVGCLVKSNTCPRSGSCAVKDIWGELKMAIDNVLSATTLQDLVQRQKNKAKTENMYYI